MSDAPEEANDVEAGAGAQTKRSRFSRSIRKVDKRQNRVSNFVYDTGSIYLHECPESPGIPIVLIVNGSVSALICIIEICKRQYLKRCDVDEDVIKKVDQNLWMLNVANFATVIWWIVLIIKANPTHDNPEAESHCNWTLYNFAYWMLVLPFLMLATSCCCACCVACVGGVAAAAGQQSSSKSVTVQIATKESKEAKDSSKDQEEKVTFDTTAN